MESRLGDKILSIQRIFPVGPQASKGLIGAAALLTAMALVIAACSKSERGPKLSKRVIPLGQPVPKGGGRYKVGNPYQIAGKWYYPKEDYEYVETGIASWYGPGFHGKRTANGEIYDQNALTAAHRTLPMPSAVRVTNLENGRSLTLRVNDRGPFARGRIIDVTDATYTLELTGTVEKLDAFVKALDMTEIIEIVRSGVTGIARGERALSV